MCTAGMELLERNSERLDSAAPLSEPKLALQRARVAKEETPGKGP